MKICIAIIGLALGAMMTIGLSDIHAGWMLRIPLCIMLGMIIGGSIAIT